MRVVIKYKLRSYNMNLEYGQDEYSPIKNIARNYKATEVLTADDLRFIK